jgi:antitoxin component YwqK of YwqJK toxin-antitoxin module
VVCVQARPRPRPTGARSYPSGDVFADGARRYWELGQLAWDGTRSFYPDGRAASEVRMVDGVLEGPATFYARDGKTIAKLSFHGGRLDGAIAIAAEETRVTATATGGVLRGPAEIREGKSAVRGAYADGLWDGAWTQLQGDRAVANATFRKGMLHGAAMVGGESGSYAGGLRNGTWRGADGTTRSEGTFDRGTGVWRQWTGTQLTREEPYLRDLRHGEMKVWSASGALTLRVVYDRGREVEHDYRDESSRWVRTPTREIRFHASGAKHEETERRDGVAHGTYTRWNEEGQVVESGAYERGKRTGIWRHRVEGAGGKRTRVTVWREGRLVEVPRWEE